MTVSTSCLWCKIHSIFHGLFFPFTKMYSHVTFRKKKNIIIIHSDTSFLPYYICYLFSLSGGPCPISVPFLCLSFQPNLLAELKR